MMKKLTAVFLTLVLLMTLSAAALAERNIVEDSPDGTFTGTAPTMEVKFAVDESYTVTIPSEITLSGTGDTRSFSPTITATTNFLGNKYLAVFLGNENWSDILYINGETSSSTPVTAKTISFTVPAGGQPVGMSVTTANTKGMNPGTGTNAAYAAYVLDTENVAEKSETLTFTADTTNLPAGSYSYTQTFHISVFGN